MARNFWAVLAAIVIVALPAVADDNWVAYTQDNSGLVSNMVKAVCVDHIGAVWFGTDNGLSRLDPDGITWTTYTTEDQLADNSINDIVFEQTSYGPEIWIATDGGVSVVSVVPDAVTFATPYRSDNTGLVSNTVYAAEVDSSHIKWFGTDSGLSTFDGSNWETYTTSTIDNILTNNRVLAIEATDSMNYFGTDGGGICRATSYDGVTSASAWYIEWCLMLSDYIYSIHVDSQGIQWYGSESGVSAHTGDNCKKNWTNYTMDSTGGGLVNNMVNTIAEDLSGFVWFGTDAGVSRFGGDSWDAFTTANTGGGLAGDIVHDIAVAKNGAVWLATNGGVSRYTGSVGVERAEKLPAAVTIDSVFPNPFNPSTTISFSLPERGFATLSVYSISGQKIRDLVSGRLEAGTHTAAWNGTDMSGAPVAAGLYIACLESASYHAVRKMILVK